MSDTPYMRVMREDERAFMQTLLGDAPSRFKIGLSNAVVVCAASMLTVVVGWSAVAWICRAAFQIEVGWRTSVGLRVLLVGGVSCVVFAIYSTVRRLRSSRDYRFLARLDLADGMVSEERLTFVEAKKFQEPEHGGLIYFLRTRDDRVLVLYDHESQDLAVEGGDPLSSYLRPKSELLMIRAPNTRLVISKTFAGNDLPTGSIREIVVPPKEWPETDEFSSIPWSDLESRYARAA